MNKIISFISTNKDIITTTISVLAFIISLYNLISGLIVNRKNIKFNVIGTYTMGNICRMKISIHNKSRKNIVIYHSSLKCKDSTGNTHEYDFRTRKYKVTDRYKEDIYTLEFPLIVYSEDIQTGFIEFKRHDNYKMKVGDIYNVLLFTSKGKCKYKFIFDHETYYNDL